MQQHIFVALSSTPLNIEEAYEFVDADENGAATLFLGRVRNHNLGQSVEGVSYDAHPILTRKVFEDICHEARSQFGETLKTYLTHFTGRLDIGGLSVIIAVGSPHRDEAFKACRYMIEQLKVRAPIWKKEHYSSGDSEWLEGHSLQNGDPQ